MQPSMEFNDANNGLAYAYEVVYLFIFFAARPMGDRQG
jgi:hypothetical protein